LRRSTRKSWHHNGGENEYSGEERKAKRGYPKKINFLGCSEREDLKDPRLKKARIEEGTENQWLR
jgi:hypothetical protein